jgi:hypothetical protein
VIRTHDCARALRVPQITIGVPGSRDDIYLRHQQVWQAMHGIARRQCGGDFLFAQVAPQLFAVRSQRLRGVTEIAVMPGQGERQQLRVSLAAMRGKNHDEPVPVRELAHWCAAKLEHNGVEVEELAVDGVKLHTGDKHLMRIRVLAANVRARVRIADFERASHAFVNGVGRGKRLGFGMLRFG